MGYSTYLTFLLGYITTLITVYYLAIKDIPYLLDLFPKFLPFALLCTVVGVPLSVCIGWIHLKRSTLFSSEQDVSVESNPYNYRFAPGINLEMSGPWNLIVIKLIKKIAEKNGLLTDEERAVISDIENKLQILNAGGYVGNPRRKTNF